jgi:hypothetical protein
MPDNLHEIPHLQRAEVMGLPPTDFRTHRIEGFAAQGGGRIDVPLVSHIEGNLWTGGCIGGCTLTEDFKYVVSLYPWEQYILAPGTERVEHKMYDSVDQALDAALDRAIEAKAMVDKGQTLIHCQAGLNRSGLIAALVLILGGREPWDAIALLREKRGDIVLCNQRFQQFLLNKEYQR